MRFPRVSTRSKSLPVNKTFRVIAETLWCENKMYTMFPKDCAKPWQTILLIKLKETYPINIYRKILRFQSVAYTFL